jgi:MFS family permease
MVLALFSIGVAIGSVLINRLLKGKVSARFAPISALVMGAFVLDLWWVTGHWPDHGGSLHDIATFLRQPGSYRVVLDLFGVAVAGGMFVVPLYAFLTTTVPASETARTIAANNIVNSGAMVVGALLAAAMALAGFGVAQILLLVVFGSIGAAVIAQRLHKACD